MDKQRLQELAGIEEAADYISPAAALRLAKELRSQMKVGKTRQAEGTIDALIRVLEKVAAADQRAMSDVEKDYPPEDTPMFLRRQAD